MRILLCTLNAKYIHVNPAIRLLYALNHEKHSGLAWKEFTIKESPDEIAQTCSSFDIVAFSCYIWNITQTLEVCKSIKLKNPNIKTLLGGPEVSYDVEDLIKNENVDYIISGEGEIPFAEFLKSFPNLQGIPGLAFKKNGILNYLPNTTQFELKNYKDIMSYQFDEVESLADRVLYIETSRGCPYKCEFCLASLDNKVRYLPDQHIKSTLLYLMKHGRTIKFLDRTFNIKKDFTLDIFDFILKYRRPENIFQFEITADILHPDIIKYINDYVPECVFRFEIGIQTVNQKANLEVKRKQNFEKTSSIIKQLQHKVEMHLDLIVGLPYDTMSEIKFSFEEVFKHFAGELQLGFLKFLKGTPMRDKEQHGFVFDPNPPYTLIESKYLSKEELHKIVCLENALEIYWNRKRTLNLLRYVGLTNNSFDFLMGLGIYFSQKKLFHAYTMNDVYEIALDFIKLNYPSDPILIQLLAIDRALHFKSRPGQTFHNEISDSLKKSQIALLPQTNVKSRYLCYALDLDIRQLSENKIVPGKFISTIRYNGVEKPELFNQEINREVLT
ncbi:MAG: DUF4080 domain-containing protein [Sphingobacteriaceae bacterium]|nr:DUF4080 domain-containing protein [Sphingobacteriaceae bacterium]